MMKIYSEGGAGMPSAVPPSAVPSTEGTEDMSGSSIDEVD